jgi:hypothetical protein
MPSRLRPQQLEARVIELVDLVLAGKRIEDDLVECKGQWPDPQRRSSTRQLAGHANKAHGEPILWIVGLDENTHMLTHPSPIEFADWWTAISSRFDPPAPELEHHLVVSVGERQAVTALRFLTERSPYVIMGGGDDERLEREVPIRDGARTRSARRDELLRLLIPAVAPPSAQLLSARLHARYDPGVEGKPSGRTGFQLVAKVFFQQPAMSAGVVMLPAHLMHGRIDVGGTIGFLHCELRYMSEEDGQPTFGGTTIRPVVVSPSVVMHGVARRKDGVVVTGPGTLTVSGATAREGDLRSRLAAVSAVSIDLSFGVAGIDRCIKLDAVLDYVPPDKPDAIGVSWILNTPADNPWAETED